MSKIIAPTPELIEECSWSPYMLDSVNGGWPLRGFVKPKYFDFHVPVYDLRNDWSFGGEKSWAVDLPHGYRFAGYGTSMKFYATQKDLLDHLYAIEKGEPT